MIGGPICGAGARVDDPEVLDLRAARIDADGELGRRRDWERRAQTRLAGRIERHRVEEQHFVAVESRVELRLRLALAGPLEELAAVLEERRVRAVAIDSSG